MSANGNGASANGNGTRRTVLRQLPPFVRWYIEAAGEYLVPEVFHYWCALSLLAAFAAKRYWYEHIRGNPLHPNLYIGLIGHSASGKGLAIRNAVTCIRPDLVFEGEKYGAEFPYLYSGRVTAQALVTHLTKLSKKVDDQIAEFYMVFPELGQSLDMPQSMVSGFVRMLTGAYDDTGAPWSDLTRTFGFHHAPQAYLNWLFGTTAEWMHDTIKDIDFQGGFAGRILPILVEDREPFKYKPSYTPLQPEFREYVQLHLRAVRSGGGPFEMTGDAEDMDAMWCGQRYNELPGDERLHPFVLRGGTLAKKLAMLFSLARDPRQRRIEAIDMRCAQQAVDAVERELPRVLDLVFTNDSTRAMELFKQLVREHGTVPRSMVMRYLMRQCGRSRKDVLEYESTLVFGRFISIDFSHDTYVWAQPA
jgi:hypothetical protein